MLKATLVLAALAVSAPVLAQGNDDAATAPAPAPAPAPAAAGAFNLDSPIADLVANPAAKAVLDEVLPGLTTIPQYEMIKLMSLNQVAPFSEGKLTPELLAKVQAKLAALPAK